MDESVRAHPFLTSLRRWWWILVAATVLAGVVGYVVSALSRPEYQATVRLLVGPFRASADMQEISGSLAATYTYYVTSKPVIDATAADLGPAIDDRYAWQETTAHADQVTRILSIDVRSDQADLAARIANGIAANLQAEVAKKDPRPEASLIVIDPAGVPSSPVAPRPLRAALIAAIAAFVGVLALAVLVETTGLLRRNRREPVETDAPASQGR